MATVDVEAGFIRDAGGFRAAAESTSEPADSTRWTSVHHTVADETAINAATNNPSEQLIHTSRGNTARGSTTAGRTTSEVGRCRDAEYTAATGVGIGKSRGGRSPCGGSTST